MAITRASEHTPDDPRTEYCSKDDVRVYLAGVAADDEGSPFEALLSRPKIDESLTKYNQVVKKLIDRRCHRDFDYHEDVEIAVDGYGTDVLDLKTLGFAPLLELSALTIDDTTEDTDNYLVYQEDAKIARTSYVSADTATSLQGVMTFSPGRQNIEATITWGYSSVPIDVEMAAALWAGALLLNPADAIQDLRAPGTATMLQSVQYGDLKIGMGSTNATYSGLATRLRKEAHRLLNGYIIPIVVGADPKRATAINENRKYYIERNSA